MAPHAKPPGKAEPKGTASKARKNKKTGVPPALVVDEEFAVAITGVGERGICLGDLHHATTYAQLMLSTADNRPFPLEGGVREVSLGVRNGENVMHVRSVLATGGLTVGAVAALLMEQVLEDVPGDEPRQIWLMAIKKGITPQGVVYFPEVQLRE